ncbi:MAG TPA: DUF2567 domain-containing protein [Mycobacteriales bacterium]|nr:DUF2567 domain-containing protein [Mycobacteriales bacterium]
MTLPAWRRQAGAAVTAACALVLLGAPVGLIWGALAPRLDFVVTAGGQGLDLVNPESEALVAADGYFVFITAVVGIACGILAYRIGRLRYGPGLVAGLAAGGLGAAAVAAQVGRRLYLPGFHHAETAVAAGHHVLLYVSVRAQPALFVWGFAAALGYGLLVAIFEREPIRRT